MRDVSNKILCTRRANDFLSHNKKLGFQVSPQARAKHPNVTKAELRKIIRDGNRELFRKKNNPNYEANTKALIRSLEKAFKNKLELARANNDVPPSNNKPSKLEL